MRRNLGVRIQIVRPSSLPADLWTPCFKIPNYLSLFETFYGITVNIYTRAILFSGHAHILGADCKRKRFSSVYIFNIINRLSFWRIVRCINVLFLYLACETEWTVARCPSYSGQMIIPNRTTPLDDTFSSALLSITHFALWKTTLKPVTRPAVTSSRTCI